MNKENHLNFWQLACLNGSFVGLPGILLGGAIALKAGPAAAITSIIIGNFALWIIGLGIISMFRGRQHAIENIKNYLGKKTSYFAAVIWVLSFITWYTIQIKGITEGFEQVIPNLTIESGVMLGVLLGFLASVISIGGLSLIQKISTIGLPLMIIYIFYVIAVSSHEVNFDWQSSLSISMILAVVLFWLSATVNLPTLFRYSVSKEDSVLGLSLATLIRTLFQMSGIFIGVTNFVSHSYLILFCLFALVSFLLSNLLNIYFASAVWETLFPKYRTKLEYLFVGLLGTAAYIAFHFMNIIYNVPYSIEFVESVLLSFIASLSVVLLVGYMYSLVVRHRPNPFQKLWCTVSWFIGCSISLYYQINSGVDSNIPLTKGVVATLISFLMIMFIEETVWSIRKLRNG
jgi:hypothetical protein